MMEELEDHFSESHKLYLSTNNSQLSSNSPEYQQQVQQALRQINAAAELVIQEHLFSKNEEVDDIRTESIKFLLAPYFQAELHLFIVDKERLDHLNSAKLYYAHFLRQCENLLLVHKDDIKALYSDTRDDPTRHREKLIARTKREKEAKLKLEALQKQKAASSGASVDEELERSVWLATINCAIPNAVRQLESTEEMLESITNIEQPRETYDSRGNKVSTRPLTQSSKPIAYTILPGGRRVDLKAQVFQPGFNMATITPEQAYEAEMKAGRMLTGGGKASEKKDSDDEDEDEDDDEKLQKARAWDAFKDDNPFGSGNTKH